MTRPRWCEASGDRVTADRVTEKDDEHWTTCSVCQQQVKVTGIYGKRMSGTIQKHYKQDALFDVAGAG